MTMEKHVLFCRTRCMCALANLLQPLAETIDISRVRIPYPWTTYGSELRPPALHIRRQEMLTSQDMESICSCRGDASSQLLFSLLIW
jgi:hypothetical protein